MMNKFPKILSYIQSIFSLDTRSLALLRIWIWCVIFVDLIVRLSFLTAFHTDFWILPSASVMEFYYLENIRSLHLISASYIRQLFLFFVHWCIAIAFIVWWKTRTVSILLRVFTLSMHGHNPLILNGWDTFTRIILFRWMFLPRWHQLSLDNVKEENPPVSIFSIATLWFICQLCFVYIFSAILKDHPRWTSEFTATYYALSLDAFRTNFWERLYMYPWLMKWLTAAFYYLESFWLLLLIIPRKRVFRRTSCVLLFVFFHAGLWLSMHLYAFPRIMWIARITLLPSEIWDRSLERLNVKWYNQNFILKTSKHLQQKFTFILSVFLIWCLAYSFAWNLRTTDFWKYQKYFPTDINRFWFLFRIDQYRNMFAPYPFVDNGWTQIQWIKADWSKVNLLHHDKQFTLQEPTDYEDHVIHERRRKYFTSMWMKDNSHFRQYWASYLCNSWNSTHLQEEEKVKKIKRRYMLNRTLDNYQSDPVKEHVLHEWDCP